MKKILSITFSLVAALLLTAGMTSCSDQAQLEKAIAQFNAKMPQEAGGGMTINQLSLADTQLTYECTQSEETDSVAFLREHQDEFKASVIQNLTKNVQNEGFRMLCEMLIDSNRGVGYTITGAKTGEVLDIVVTPAELGDILNGKITAPAPVEAPADSTAATETTE